MAVYELPDLPYAYDALEPHISAEIMELHHDKHHNTYVKGANAALEALEEERNGEANPDKLRAGVATSLQGSGWAVLGWDHIAGRLIIEQLTDQAGNTSIDLTPVLMLDMWEHAYYLQYKNVKGDYVKAFWNVVNWDDVAERFAKASAH